MNTRVANICVFLSIILVLMHFSGCRAIQHAQEVAKQPAKESETPLRLVSIVLDKKAFEPDRNECTAISFKASKSCSATIHICDSRGIPVKLLLNDKKVLTASETIKWDGSDNNARLLPQGLYFYVVELEDGSFKFTYNPYQNTHGITLKSVTGAYDQENEAINYNLPQAAQVRIRVGLKDGGPLLATPLDWSPKPAGKYSIKWDGKDSSGFINLAEHPNRNLVIFAYTLADNSIILDSKQAPSLANNSQITRSIFSPELPPDRDIHARNYPKLSHEPKISVDFQGEFPLRDEGIPILDGITPVKISIAPEDRIAMENSRYEIMIFVDTVFLFEDESGFSPFTYMWDTRSLPKGEHLLTVNVWSYDDNCGVSTRKVHVKDEK